MVGIYKQGEICQLWTFGGCFCLIELTSGFSLPTVNPVVLDTLLLELPASSGNMLTGLSCANVSARVSVYSSPGCISHCATDTIHIPFIGC